MNERGLFVCFFGAAAGGCCLFIFDFFQPHLELA